MTTHDIGGKEERNKQWIEKISHLCVYLLSLTSVFPSEEYTRRGPRDSGYVLASLGLGCGNNYQALRQ